MLSILGDANYESTSALPKTICSERSDGVADHLGLVPGMSILLLGRWHVPPHREPEYLYQSLRF